MADETQGGRFTTPPGGSRGTGHENVEGAKQTARNVTEQAKEKGKQAAAERKNAAAQYVGSFSGALHDTARNMENESPTTARYVRRAADTLDDFSNRLENRSVDDLAHEIRQMARRRPAVLLGGAVVAGFLLARFFKASGEHSEGGGREWNERTGAWTETGWSSETTRYTEPGGTTYRGGM